MANIGWASIQIVPSARGFRRRLEQAVDQDLAAAGRSGGESYGRGLTRAIAPSVDRTSTTIRSGLTGAAASAGRAFVALGSFGARAGARITTSLGRVAKVALPAVVAALAAAAGGMVALGSAAAVAAAAVGAAFAGIGIGFTIAAQTERGQQALKQFKTDAKKILTDAAAPMVGAFETALTQVEGLLRNLKPVMRETFTALAETVEQAAPRIREALTIISGPLGELVEAGGMFITSFAERLPGVAEKLKPALADIAPDLKEFARWLGPRLARFLENSLPQLIRLAEDALPLLKGAISGALTMLRGFITLGKLVVDAVTAVALAVAAGGHAFLKLKLRINQAVDALPGLSRESAIATTKQQLLASAANIAGLGERLMGNEARAAAADLAAEAHQAGVAAEEISHMTSQIHLVPEEVRTRIRNNADTAAEAVEKLNAAINNVDTYTRVTFEAQYLGFKDVGGTVTGPQYARGGYVFGPGTATSDSITARLSRGEYVVNAAAVDHYGRELFDRLNARKLAGGGLVGPAAPAAATAQPHQQPLMHLTQYNYDQKPSRIVEEALFEMRRQRLTRPS